MCSMAGEVTPKDYRNSTQRAVRAIARVAISHDGSVRLPTAQDYQQENDVGSGTVQKAFSILEDAGALETRARGQHGRFIIRRDIGRLWPLAGLPPIRAVVTPPGAIEIYGIVSGLASEFERLGIPFEVDYIRGGEQRLAEINFAPTSFAVMSTRAAEKAVQLDARFTLVAALDPGTYYSPGSVVVVSSEGFDHDSDTLRLGVDHGSYDNVIFTEAEFGDLSAHDVRECTFLEIPSAILEGRIDAGVWHRMLLLISPELAGLKVTSLNSHSEQTVNELSAAAFVAPSDRDAVIAALREVSPDTVATHQVDAIARSGTSSERIWYR